MGESIADPEARAVTEVAVAQMKRLKEKFDCKDAEGGKLTIIQFGSTISTALMNLKFMEDLQWTNNLAKYTGIYFDKDTCSKAIEEIRVEAEKMMEIPDDDDDEDDAEELCNCTFTLAYG